MTTFFSTYLPVAAIAIALVAGLCFYFLRYKRLPRDQALSKAVQIAYKFWQAYSFKMPGLLLAKSITTEELIEAGLVLKSLVVGEVKDSSLSPELRRAQPGLVSVDPWSLASAVRKVGLGDYGHQENPAEVTSASS